MERPGRRRRARQAHGGPGRHPPRRGAWRSPASAPGSRPGGSPIGRRRRMSSTARCVIPSIPYAGHGPDHPDRPDELVRERLPHPHVRRAARVRRGQRGSTVGLGQPAAGPGRPDLPRPPGPPRDHPGRHRPDGLAGGARGGQPRPQRVRGDGRGDRVEAAPRHREREAADRRDRGPGDRSRDPERVEDAAVLHQRARRPGRRVAPAQVPLPRPPARAHREPARAPEPARPRDPSRRTSAPASSRSRRRTSSRRRPKARETSSSRAGCVRARSTRCRRARSSSSSC